MDAIAASVLWQVPEGALLRHRERHFAIDQDVFGDIQFNTYKSNGAAVMHDEDIRRRYLDMMGLEGEDIAIALGKYSLEDYLFLRALNEERAPYPGFDVAVQAHEIVDAVYSSAADGGAEVRLAD